MQKYLFSNLDQDTFVELLIAMKEVVDNCLFLVLVIVVKPSSECGSNTDPELQCCGRI